MSKFTPLFLAECGPGLCSAHLLLFRPGDGGAVRVMLSRAGCTLCT